MPHRILVVDDEPGMRTLYHRALDPRGFVVTTAPSGLDALDLVGEDFSVIITDYGMPGMDGLELIRAVRARGLETPVLIVSGDFEVGRNGDLPRGVTAVLRKPFLIEELLDAIREACAIASRVEARRSPSA